MSNTFDDVTPVHVDIETNGDAPDPVMPPEVVEAAVRKLIDKDKQREREVDGLTTAVDELRSGNTLWQRQIKSSLRTITDKVHVLAMERVVKPTFVAIALMFVGGACADLLFHLVTK